MTPRWARNSATRSAWTSSSSRYGSAVRIVERMSDHGAVPPWSKAQPTIWWAKTSRARRWMCSGSRSCSCAAWTAARDSMASSDETARTSPLDVRSSVWPERPSVHEDERRSALVEGVVDRREAGRGLRGDVEVASGLEVLVDRTRPFDSIIVSFLERCEEDFEGVLAAEERGDRIRMAYRGGKADTLEVPFHDSTEPLESDGELDSPSVSRELMDFIDDDVSHRLEVTLHQFPGEDRLQGLRGGDEDVGGIGGLLSAIRSRRVAVPHGGCETRGRYEALDTVDQIPIKGSQGRDVEGPDPIPLAG